MFVCEVRQAFRAFENENLLKRTKSGALRIEAEEIGPGVRTEGS